MLIGLNRPEKYNGFTPKMSRELTAAYDRLTDDEDVWVGVVFGHGDHFTAGLDLPMWKDSFSAGQFTSSETQHVDYLDLGRARGCHKPIVTAVHGITYTIGIELALAGDIVIAAQDAQFSQIEPARGIHATGGATIRFTQRCGWGNAMYHLLTADRFDAQEAYRIGLVQEVVEPGHQLDRAIEIATIIAAQAPLAVQATKASARRFVTQGFADAVAQLDPVQASLMKTSDVAEGISSFVQRRTATFKGR